MREKINALKIVEHQKVLDQAQATKAEYESYPADHIYWKTLRDQYLQKLMDNLNKYLPENKQFGENLLDKIDTTLINLLCRDEVWSSNTGLKTTALAQAKVAEALQTGEYLCFNIWCITDRTYKDQYHHTPGHRVIAYTLAEDMEWFRDGMIYAQNHIIHHKKSAITLLSKKLTRPISEILPESMQLSLF